MDLIQVEQLTSDQAAQLHALYQNEWWSEDRELLDVHEMLKNTNAIFAFVSADDDRLVAFARVLTDFVYHAVIFDVIVAKPFRSQGLGRRMMDTIKFDVRLRSVPVFWLCCLPEMVPFYEKWEFTDEIGDLKWMKLVVDDR